MIIKLIFGVTDAITLAAVGIGFFACVFNFSLDAFNEILKVRVSKEVMRQNNTAMCVRRAVSRAITSFIVNGIISALALLLYIKATNYFTYIRSQLVGTEVSALASISLTAVSVLFTTFIVALTSVKAHKYNKVYRKANTIVAGGLKGWWI